MGKVEMKCDVIATATAAAFKVLGLKSRIASSFVSVTQRKVGVSWGVFDHDGIFFNVSTISHKIHALHRFPHPTTAFLLLPRP